MPESKEERLSRLRWEMEQRTRLFKKLIDQFGPEVLEVARQDLIDATAAQFSQMDLPRRDLQAVIDLLWGTAIGDDLDYTIEEQTPEHMRMKVTRCMWADEMRRLDAGDLGYVFSCCWDYGFCQGLNPAIQFTRTKTLMQGDEYCDHTYDLKAES